MPFQQLGAIWADMVANLGLLASFVGINYFEQMADSGLSGLIVDPSFRVPVVTGFGDFAKMSAYRLFGTLPSLHAKPGAL